MLADKQESPTKGEGRGQHRWRWRRDLTLGVQEPHPRAALPSPYGPQAELQGSFSYSLCLHSSLFLLWCGVGVGSVHYLSKIKNKFNLTLS